MPKFTSLLTAVALGAALLSSGAQAITYTVNLSVGVAAFAVGTIDTTGNFGVLADSDIASWSLLLNDGATSILLNPVNGMVQVYGDSFTATSSGLFFNFSNSGPFSAVLFQALSSPGQRFLCFNDPGGGCSGAPRAIGVTATNATVSSAENFGVAQVATVAENGVPEPATWATMITGPDAFGPRRCGAAGASVAA